MLQDDKSTSEKSKEKSEKENETDKDSKTEKDIDESQKKVTSGRLRCAFWYFTDAHCLHWGGKDQPKWTHVCTNEIFYAIWYYWYNLKLVSAIFHLFSKW